jgi:uncharacterized NAD(P)/FAD-binding protein YdhS
MAEAVAIVGGGASGVLLAVNLLRTTADLHVTVFEPAELGYGMAYSTTCPLHLLNVPAGKMSAFPGEPGHFLAWLEGRCPGQYGPISFVSRALFGEYLHELAVTAAADNPSRFTHVRTRITAAALDGPRAVLHGEDGTSFEADALVLATGNSAPIAWRGLPSDPRAFASAWQPGALESAAPNETVLVLGTGLTAIDAVLGLRHNGHRGKIYLVSRRGLLPHEHRVFDAPPPVRGDAASLRDVLSAFRKESGNWRMAIDNVRPITNDLWSKFERAERLRFLRHAAPYWSVHRHRMAPEVAADMAQLFASGTLEAIAGRTQTFEVRPDALVVSVRERGTGNVRTIEVQRAINCSGPDVDVTRSSNPLLRSLTAEGLLTPTALGIGLDVDEHGAAVDRHGNVSKRLFTIGPVRFGSLIETTAIPEIRMQAADLARYLEGVPA